MSASVFPEGSFMARPGGDLGHAEMHPTGSNTPGIAGQQDNGVIHLWSRAVCAARRSSVINGRYIVTLF